MKREILFRGKRLDDGEWIEGYLYRISENLDPLIMLKRKLGESYEVAPSTICQYTGLTDKDGRKVFEGDIVRYTDEVIGKEKIDEVKYNETHAAFCRLHKSEMGLQYLFIDEAAANKCEVIGNIFDNPDLRRRDGKDSTRMIYEYYVVIMYDTPLLKRSCAGLCYKLDYKLDSTENIIKFADILKNEGYQTPVVLFFKQLNE